MNTRRQQETTNDPSPLYSRTVRPQPGQRQPRPSPGHHNAQHPRWNRIQWKSGKARRVGSRCNGGVCAATHPSPTIPPTSSSPLPGRTGGTSQAWIGGERRIVWPDCHSCTSSSISLGYWSRTGPSHNYRADPFVTCKLWWLRNTDIMGVQRLCLAPLSLFHCSIFQRPRLRPGRL